MKSKPIIIEIENEEQMESFGKALAELLLPGDVVGLKWEDDDEEGDNKLRIVVDGC